MCQVEPILLVRPWASCIDQHEALHRKIGGEERCEEVEEVRSRSSDGGSTCPHPPHALQF